MSFACAILICILSEFKKKPIVFFDDILLYLACPVVLSVRIQVMMVMRNASRPYSNTECSHLEIIVSSAG